MRPGTKAICCMVAGAFVIDAWLVQNGHETISTCVRSSRVARVATAVFAGHLMATWRYDPIKWIGDRATERWFNNGEFRR